MFKIEHLKFSLLRFRSFYLHLIFPFNLFAEVHRFSVFFPSSLTDKQTEIFRQVYQVDISCGYIFEIFFEKKKTETHIIMEIQIWKLNLKMDKVIMEFLEVAMIENLLWQNFLFNCRISIFMNIQFYCLDNFFSFLKNSLPYPEDILNGTLRLSFRKFRFILHLFQFFVTL